jgi:hypothetical protein
VAPLAAEALQIAHPCLGLLPRHPPLRDREVGHDLLGRDAVGVGIVLGIEPHQNFAALHSEADGGVELLAHLQTPAAFGGHELGDWPEGQIASGFGGDPAAQRYMQDAAAKLSTPRLVNLTADPQEREPVSLPYLHSWVAAHFNRLIGQFEASLHREPPIPMGAPLDHVPAPPTT